MSKSIFISYSRREAPFVNGLADDLEKHGFSVWLDFRCMVPGQPWEKQLYEGISQADVVVLVISKHSISSKNVWKEIRDIRNKGKRVILALFEAVPLDAEMEDIEWVDFRKSYKAGLKELIRQATAQEEEESKPPQKGGGAPTWVWITMLAAAVTAFASLPSIWTLILPFILLTLPYRIYKRDFNFVRVRAALVALPFVNLYSIIPFGDSIPEDTEINFLIFSFISAAITLILLHSKPMQRWGRPVAVRPKTVKKIKVQEPNPAPTAFYLDYAPEDEKMAVELTNSLTKYGHKRVQTCDEAAVSFVLVSGYKKDTHLNPEEKMVIPIVLQHHSDIDPKIKEVQWIDFSGGFKNLKELAALLPEPENLLRGLGIMPAGRQTVTPPIIQAITYFVIAQIVVTLGSWLLFFLQLWNDIVLIGIDILYTLLFIGVLALLVWVGHRLIRNLNQRTGQPYSVVAVILHLLIFAALVYGQSYIGPEIGGLWEVMDFEQGDRGLSFIIPLFMLEAGLVLIGLFIIRYWKALNLWLPKKVQLDHNPKI